MIIPKAVRLYYIVLLRPTRRITATGQKTTRFAQTAFGLLILDFS